MKLPQIRLQSTNALIAIETTHAKAYIQQPEAELHLEQPPAELTINRTPSKLTIDQTEAWESMDLKTIRKRMEEFAEEGEKKLLEGIARRVRDGDELMEISKGGNPIAAQAKRNSQDPPKQFNIGYIPPLFSVKLDYQPAEIDIDWKVNKVINNTKVNEPIIDYVAGDVETSLRQKESLKIDFEHVNF